MTPDATERWPCDRWRAPLLIARLSSLGDVILATSVLRLLHERRPELPVDFLTRTAYAPLLSDHPALRAVATHSSATAHGHLLDLQGGRKGSAASPTSVRRTPLFNRMCVVNA